MQTATKEIKNQTTDNFPINGTDYIEFYCGNAKQSAIYYQTAFGFKLVAYCGPETGVRDRASYVLQQDKIRLVLTSAMGPEHEISQHVLRHGDGVKVLALWVDDAEKAYHTAMERGAVSASAHRTGNASSSEAATHCARIMEGSPNVQERIHSICGT